MITIPSPIRIASVQCDLATNDIEANLHHLEQIIRARHTEADLFVLPEVFSTGFSPDASSYADAWATGRIYRWLMSLSTEYGVGIAGSYITSDAGALYNRFVLVDGTQVAYQDKRHLFSLGGEPGLVVPASERRILDFRGWRILPIICYDLRFPVWCRNVRNEYDLIVAVASWPRGRRAVWQTLLRARAMENLAYCVGANRIGRDEQGLSYSGDSCLINPRGETLAECIEHTEDVAIATCDYAPLADLRHKFPVWQDADSFAIHL